MTSTSDILTAAKNIVTALNQISQTIIEVYGSTARPGISSATVVAQGQGRVVNVSVTVAGSASGSIYDGTVATATRNPIYRIPTTIGIYEVNMPVSNGIVVAPGTGQTVSISYS